MIHTDVYPPQMIPTIRGGYTSVCITGALWYVMKTRLGEEAKAAIAASGTKTVSDVYKRQIYAYGEYKNL